MQAYNVLVETSLRLGNGSIKVVTVAFKGICDINLFKESMSKAIELANRDTDESDREIWNTYYSDDMVSYSFENLLEYRVEFEEGLMMYALL